MGRDGTTLGGVWMSLSDFMEEEYNDEEYYEEIDEETALQMIYDSTFKELPNMLRYIPARLRDRAILHSKRIADEGNVIRYLAESGIVYIEHVFTYLALLYAESFITFQKRISDILESEVPDADQGHIEYFSFRHITQAHVKLCLEMTYSIVNGIKNVAKMIDTLPAFREAVASIEKEKREKALADLKKIGHDCMNCPFLPSKELCEIYRAIPNIEGE